MIGSMKSRGRADAWIVVPSVNGNLPIPPGVERVEVRQGWTYLAPQGPFEPFVWALARMHPVAVIETAGRGWALTAFAGDECVSRHDSFADPAPDQNDLDRVRGHDAPMGRRGSPEDIGRLYCIPPARLEAYLPHRTRAEAAALDLLSDGLGPRFSPPPSPDDLHSPLAQGFGADAAARLGAKGARELFPASKAPDEPFEAAPELDPEDARLALEALEARDAWRRLAAARLLLPVERQPAVRTLRHLSRREDSLGAEAARILAASWDPDLLREVLPLMDGLLPLEQAAIIRHAAQTEDASLADRVKSFLASPSLLVRMEVLEALARCDGGTDLPALRRFVSVAEGPDLALGLAVVGGLGDARAAREAARALAQVSDFVDETLPLRHGSLTVRHASGHLRARVGSLRFLRSLDEGFDDRARLEPTVDLTSADPVLGGVVERVRACGVKVELEAGVDADRSVPARAEGHPDLPLYKVVETAIRSSEGRLGVTAKGNTLHFHPEGGLR